MKNILKINGKKYTAKEFDFNALCDFSDMGVDIGQASEKPMNFLRAYIAFCSGLSVEEAGNEITQHIIGGGKIDEAIEIMSAKMDESGFFRALSKATEENLEQSEE